MSKSSIRNKPYVGLDRNGPSDPSTPTASTRSSAA